MVCDDLFVCVLRDNLLVRDDLLVPGAATEVEKRVDRGRVAKVPATNWNREPSVFGKCKVLNTCLKFTRGV